MKKNQFLSILAIVVLLFNLLPQAWAVPRLKLEDDERIYGSGDIGNGNTPVGADGADDESLERDEPKENEAEVSPPLKSDIPVPASVRESVAQEVMSGNSDLDKSNSEGNEEAATEEDPEGHIALSDPNDIVVSLIPEQASTEEISEEETYAGEQDTQAFLEADNELIAAVEDSNTESFDGNGDADHGNNSRIYYFVAAGVALLLALICFFVFRIKRSKADSIQRTYQPDIPADADYMTFTYLSGEKKGCVDVAAMKDRYVIGSSQDCDVIVRGMNISDKHARIYVNNGRLFVEDLDTDDGTFLNGMRLYSSNRLKKDSIITVGFVSFIVSF